jgi:hypothetical protein
MAIKYCVKVTNYEEQTMRRLMRVRGTFFALLVVLLAGGATNLVYAQLTAQITGTVADSTGAVIPGVMVTVRNEGTGIQWEVKTNEAGIYTVPLLQPGIYQINVQAQGFKPVNRSGIRLGVAQTAKVDFSLEVGTATDSIDVTDTAPLLDAGTNAIGGSVTSDKVENLPLKGRNSSAFMMLVPGVRATRATITQPVLESHYQFFSVNGSRPGQNQFRLDGGNNTNVGFNSPEYSVQVEAVQEFKVQTSNFSAEYANAAGAVINFVTKSGTNELHGSLFEYFRNDALAATDFFSNAAGKKKPMFRFNQFGGTAGGPIRKNRTFFFGGYEGLRLRDPVITTTSVPTDLQRSGDFSRTFTASGELIGVYDPLTTRQDPQNPGKYIRTPFAGNIIPGQRISPIALTLQKYYPTATSNGDPNTGLNNFFFSGPRTRPVNDYNGRVDHQLSQSTILMGRVSKSSTVITNPAIFGESNLGSPGYSRNPQSHTSVLTKTMETFSPSLFGEFVASFARFYFDRRGLSNGFDPVKLGFPAYITANSPNLGFPGIGIDSMAGLGGYNNEHDAYDRYETKANLSKLRGSHTLKFGGLFSVVKFNSRQNSTQVGSYSFGKSFTQGPDPLLSGPGSGFGYATFLLGTLTGGSHNANDVHVSLAQKYIGAYFQDDWKVTPRLNLNLGLRYDLETPRTERYNQLANFNYTALSTLSNGVIVRGGLMYPGVNGLPRGHWNAQNKNFAPRIGFAYTLTTDTVIRGGFGMFYSNSWGSGRNGNGMPITGFTCSTAITSSLDGGLTPFAVIGDPFPRGFCKATGSSAGLLTSLGQGIDMIDRNQKIPYAESWNLDIQRRLPRDVLFEIAYSGSRGIHLAGTLEYNQLAPQYMKLGTQLNKKVANPFYGVISEGPLSEQTITLGQSLRPYPQFQWVSSRDATYGASVYHALYAKLERRFSDGFSVLASYTWSKLIDDVIPSRTGFPGESFSGAPLQNYYDRRSERSLASFDTPQTLVVSTVYELPLGPGKKLNLRGPAGVVFGGWQLNAITMFQSGPPLQVNGGNDSGSFAGTQRPNWSGKNATKSGAITDRLGAYFDTSVFSFNDPFTFGNAPRIMPNLRGPGAANVDLSVFKNTRITEHVRLQFRVESFNAFNRVQFQIPNTSINSAAFGRISAQANSPRDIQLALKLLF